MDASVQASVTPPVLPSADAATNTVAPETADAASNATATATAAATAAVPSADVATPPTESGAAAGAGAGAGAGADVAAAAAAAGKTLEEYTSSDYYKDSYSHFSIHEEMLKDEVRTKSYMHSMLRNSHLFEGKVVLDVGCGTGILSMFAAKAGAKHVYSVDFSSIIDQAKLIVEANGFKDQITLIRGKMEEIELPVDKVDIIISEWMGYFLLYESMLNSVIFARDKYLVEGGLVFPDKATLYLGAIEDGAYKEEKIAFWDSVYGFDMSCIKELAMLEPLVDTVEGSSVCSEFCPLLELDLTTCTVEDLSFTKPFQFRFTRKDYCHAIIGFFDCDFSCCHKPVTLSTSPLRPYTHWKQTVFYLDDVLTVDEGEMLSGTLTCVPNKKNERDLDITIKYNFDGRTSKADHSQFYRLR